jgi:hypothetical protein
MRRLAVCLSLLLASPFVLGPADAASGGFQSSRGGNSSSSAGHPPPHNIPPRPGLPGAGLPGQGFQGRGIPGAGIRRPGEGGAFRDRDRFLRNRGGFRGDFIGGASIFVPVPDVLGLPYYDGFEYPYFYPGTGAPFVPDGYAPPDYLPPAYIPPQDYVPPTANQPAGPPIWYYCQDPMGYYPYVRDCNGPWQAVPASVLPPPTPQ